MASSSPIIAVSGCRFVYDGFEHDGVPQVYIEALEQICGALPLVIPTLGGRLDRRALLEHVDGLLFTGSASNVEPYHYGGDDSAEGTLHDPYRDATTLPLIREAVAAGLPVLCVCRGFQELNVAYGGSLHQRVHELPGFMDHRSNPEETWEQRFGPAHEVSLTEGGRFAALAGATRITVNTVHGQGIDRLGDGLTVEATAPDGLIEAATVDGARSFAAGVQWHPEWRATENAFSRALFTAFGEAARNRNS